MTIDFDVGTLDLVWSWPAFLLSAGFGFGFGYLVVASIAAQSKWQTDNRPAVYGWLVGALSAWFLVGLTMANTMASLIEGDPGWSRVLSRGGPFLATAFFVGVGTWRGLIRAQRK